MASACLHATLSMSNLRPSPERLVSPTAFVARFAAIYWPSLAALEAALHQAGNESGTVKNMVIFVVALALASRHIGPSRLAGSKTRFLSRSVLGIACCDAMAQALIAWHWVSTSGDAELWRSLPFVAVTTVLMQTGLAYVVLRRQLRGADEGPRGAV